MPIKVRCACGREMVAKDEIAGKKVRCPACQAILVVGATEPAAVKVGASGPPPMKQIPAKAAPTKSGPAKKQPEPEPEEEEDAPTSRKLRDKLRGLSLANTGLMLHLIRFSVLLAIAVLILLSYGLGGTYLASGEGGKVIQVVKREFSFMPYIMLILYIPTIFLAIGGDIFCFLLPSKTGGKAPIMVSLGCTVASHILFFVTLVLLVLSEGWTTVTTESGIPAIFDPATLWKYARFALLAYVIALALWLAADISFFGFLRNMCRYVDNGEQADKANHLMVMWLLMIFVPPGLIKLLEVALNAVLSKDMQNVTYMIVFAVFIGVMVAWSRILFMVIRIILVIRKVISSNLR